MVVLKPVQSQRANCCTVGLRQVGDFWTPIDIVLFEELQLRSSVNRVGGFNPYVDLYQLFDGCEVCKDLCVKIHGL